MNNPMIHMWYTKEKGYSIVARLWNPQKKFYEHPTLINLSHREAQEQYDRLISKAMTIENIVDDWVYIGD